jgi:hypothetical protein
MLIKSWDISTKSPVELNKTVQIPLMGKWVPTELNTQQGLQTIELKEITTADDLQNTVAILQVYNLSHYFGSCQTQELSSRLLLRFVCTN